ncbi:cytochrome P450 [Xylariales sp. PMI_506]|nr:cytochrome P450 [Xylariales sp. PMI_506]
MGLLPMDEFRALAPTWLSVSTVVGGCIAVLLVVIIHRVYYSPLSQIPGPALASITRFWHIGKILQGKQNYTLVELHEKHGPFVRIAPNEVSVSHPAGVKALYLASVRKGEWYRIFVFPDWRFPSAISIQDPKVKAEFMKYMSNAGFLLHNVLKYEGVMDNLMGRLVGWMDDYASTGKPMDLDKFFTYVAFDITGEVTFSRAFGFIEEGRDVGNAIATNVGLQIFLCTFGFFRRASYLLNNPFMTWTQLLPVGHIVNTAITALADRRANLDANFDMAAHWFRGVDKAKKEGYANFSERHVLAAAVSNLGAGSDTVSCGMQTFVYHMIHHPQRWQRVRDEIDAALREGRCQTQIVNFEDASRLPYLEAAIMESLRILAPVPMGLPRVAPRGGIMIGDTHFPAGTTLSINPTVMHLSKDIWGPDAHEFNPDRWLSADISKRDKYFMPWGLGWGSCPGQHLAKVQLFKLLATIVRDYDIKLVHPEQEWKWSAYFTLNPHSWPVYITKRE